VLGQSSSVGWETFGRFSDDWLSAAASSWLGQAVMERAEREFDASQGPADAPCDGSRGGAREEALDNDGVKPSLGEQIELAKEGRRKAECVWRRA
jgi:hypothetical protein